MKTLLVFLCLILHSGDNQIFKTAKCFLYSIQYHQNELKITTNEKISLTITGNAWKNSSNQEAAIWKYESKSKTKLVLKDQLTL
jgi:hypothetical protein